MKNLFLGLVLGLAFLWAPQAMAQTFTNTTNETVQVRYHYSTSTATPCTGTIGVTAVSVGPNSTYPFPAPPAGTNYYRCDVGFYSCTGYFVTVMMNTGSNGCNGPHEVKTTCGSSGGVSITNYSPFDVKLF